MEVGDAVMYMPHVCHATNKDAHGNYPWVMARTVHKVTVEDGRQKSTPEDIELDHRAAAKYFTDVRKHPDPQQLLSKLKLVRPACAWPGVVTGVNEDGTYNIDICSHHGGVTLHYDGVKEGLEPHCVYPASQEDVDRHYVWYRNRG